MQTDPKSIYRVFVKFISSERVDLLVNEGLLYMNTVDYFRGVEDEDIVLRGDPHEGLAASYDSQRVILNFGGHEITGTTGKIDLRYNYEDQTNLFCLTAINDQDLLNADGKLYLSENFKKFGDKAVVIGGSNISVFLERVKKALQNDPNIVLHPNQEVAARPVEYLSRDAHHLSLGVFKKFEEYSWQHEWRIAIKQTLTDGAYDGLRIGSIEDICMVFDTVDLISQPILMELR